MKFKNELAISCLIAGFAIFFVSIGFMQIASPIEAAVIAATGPSMSLVLLLTSLWIDRRIRRDWRAHKKAMGW